MMFCVQAILIMYRFFAGSLILFFALYAIESFFTSSISVQVKNYSIFQYVSILSHFFECDMEDFCTRHKGAKKHPFTQERNVGMMLQNFEVGEQRSANHRTFTILRVCFYIWVCNLQLCQFLRVNFLISFELKVIMSFFFSRLLL